MIVLLIFQEDTRAFVSSLSLPLYKDTVERHPSISQEVDHQTPDLWAP